MKKKEGLMEDQGTGVSATDMVESGDYTIYCKEGDVLSGLDGKIWQYSNSDSRIKAIVNERKALLEKLREEKEKVISLKDELIELVKKGELTKTVRVLVQSGNTIKTRDIRLWSTSQQEMNNKDMPFEPEPTITEGAEINPLETNT